MTSLQQDPLRKLFPEDALEVPPLSAFEALEKETETELRPFYENGGYLTPDAQSRLRTLEDLYERIRSKIRFFHGDETISDSFNNGKKDLQLYRERVIAGL
jgi:hypothetical protein